MLKEMIGMGLNRRDVQKLMHMWLTKMIREKTRQTLIENCLTQNMKDMIVWRNIFMMYL